MNDKLYKLYHWLAATGLTSEANSLSALINKRAITLDELRREFPEASTGTMLPSHHGGQDISLDDLRSLFPEANISSQVPATIDQLKREIQIPRSIESKVLETGFVVRISDYESHDAEFINSVQTLLRDKGYDLGHSTTTGRFDENMKNALVRFQDNNSISPSGHIDRETLTRLKSSQAISEQVSLGPPASEVEAEVVGSESSTNNEESTGSNVDLGPGAVLRPRNAPEEVVRRERRASEIIAPKFSFTEEPCLNCAAMAIQESKDRWNHGNITERDPEAEATIMEYYRYSSRNNSWKKNLDRWGTEGTRRYGPRAGKHQMNPVKERDENGVATNWWHWSAVFTSFIMGQHDGEGAKWFVSEAHTPYADDAKRKKAMIEKAPEDHIGKMYYVWFSRAEMNKLGMKPEPGDLIGTNSHYDIYVGNGMMIGGNTIAKNEHTGNKRVHRGGTSGAQPVRWKAGGGIIKRIRVTGPGQNSMVA